MRSASHRPPTRRDVLASALALAATSAVASARTSLIPRAFADALTSGAPTTLATPDGQLRGTLLPDGSRQFRGVRFAEPPTGISRFKPPVPVRAWSGTRDALHFAPAARQPGEPGIGQSEDCLFLNVFVPAGRGPYPVFVWIHGGGYTGGNSFAPVFDGSAFARDGIVCVTVAYRLGAFGFLDLGPLGPDYAGSANNGVRDLVESLRWVKRNIAAFAGDPTRVTVGGESAGAKATAALMAIPEAQPLFHSAISESGGGERVLTAAQAAEVFHRFADQWLQSTPGAAHTPSAPDPRNGSTPSTAGLSGLLTADAADLLAAQQRTIAASTIHFPFRPEVDLPLPGTPAVPPHTAYLAARPVDLVAAGSSRGKRLLLGTNRDESALFLGPHPAADPTAADLGNLRVSRFTEILPRYATIYPDMSAPERRIRAVTAEEYWVPSVRLADAHVRAGGSAWMYRLDFSPTTGRFAGEAYHSSDLDLVWNHLTPVQVAEPAAVELAREIHTAWCAFIRGETPAAPGLPTWPAYNPDTRPTLLLDRTSRIEDRPAEAELRLWDGVL